MSCSHLVFAVASLLPCAMLAGASENPPVQEGSRVRIQLARTVATADRRGGAQVVGQIVEMHDDVLVIVVKGRPTRLTVPLAAISHMDMSRGPRPASARVARGAGIGLLAGGVGGAVFGLSSADSSGGGLFHYTTSDVVALGAIYGGGVGLLVGAVVGFALPSERWSPVRLKRAHVSVTPVARGRGLRLAVSF